MINLIFFTGGYGHLSKNLKCLIWYGLIMFPLFFFFTVAMVNIISETIDP